MGNGIAHTFAQAGFLVNLADISQVALDKDKKPSPPIWIE
jgi:3-hydroxybutyryl-CoA dehydrogenase